jgi:ABC-type multidrug transport system fused ATPase/permease subunit
MKIPVN